MTLKFSLYMLPLCFFFWAIRRISVFVIFRLYKLQIMLKCSMRSIFSRLYPVGAVIPRRHD